MKFSLPILFLLCALQPTSLFALERDPVYLRAYTIDRNAVPLKETSRWTLYTNKKLGFSVSVPRSVVAGSAGCMPPVPVRLTEDLKTNSISVGGTGACGMVVGWKLTLVRAYRSNDLEKIIKTAFGPFCTMGSERPSFDRKFYDIVVLSNGKGRCDSKGAILKFSFKKGKAVYWKKSANTPDFRDEKGRDYDSTIVRTFRFI